MATITTVPTNFIDPINAVPVLGGLTPAAFWKTLFPHFANTSNLRFFDGTNCPVTFTDPQTGAAIDVSGLGYRLPDGQLAPWMANSGNIIAKKVRVTGYFSYTELLPGANQVTGATVGNKEEHIDITLTNAVSGTYTTVSSVTAGEPLPTGLAGYIMALESIPQYEGSVLVQETEISDVCPLGNALNITGGLAEWASMLACVQSVRYSDNGQTEITIGPAKHLGPAQFVARFRSNIGPRWYWLINTNPMNTGGGGGANTVSPNVAQQAPGAGAKQLTFQSFFTSLTSQQAAPATLPAGVHIDSGAAANPFTGSTPSGSRAFAQGQGITMAQGTESNAWIRVHIADLKDQNGSLQNLHVYLREMQTCENVNGTPTQMMRLFLCSEPYTTSLGI